MHGHAAPEREAYFWKQQLDVMANQRPALFEQSPGVGLRGCGWGCVHILIPYWRVLVVLHSLSRRSQRFHWVIEAVSKRHSLSEDTSTWTLSGRSSAAQLLQANGVISSWTDRRLRHLWPCWQSVAQRLQVSGLKSLDVSECEDKRRFSSDGPLHGPHFSLILLLCWAKKSFGSQLGQNQNVEVS